jgi:chemotaxis signal transduction protein
MEALAPLASENLPAQSCYGFTLHGIGLMAGFGVMTEYLTQVAVFPIPASSTKLVGVANHHGAVIPVFSLEPHPAPRTDVRPKNSNFLILGESKQRAALLIDAMPVLLELKASQETIPLPKSHLAPYLSQPWLSQSDASIWWHFDYKAALLDGAQSKPAATNQESTLTV